MSTNTQKNLFSREDKEGVTILSFCDEAYDLLGANLDLTDQLWHFFEQQERHPSNAIVLHLPTSTLGPDSLDKLLPAYGLSPNGQSGTPSKLNGIAIARGKNTMQHFIKEVINMEAVVVAAIGGHMALPLLGPSLACDFRIVSEDFTLINRMVHYSMAPMGGLPWFLFHMLGRKQASRIISHRVDIHAEEAEQLGLVDQVVSQNRLLDTAIAVAQNIAGRPYGCRAALKQMATATGCSLSSYMDEEENLFNKSLAKWHTSLKGFGARR